MPRAIQRARDWTSGTWNKAKAGLVAGVAGGGILAAGDKVADRYVQAVPQIAEAIRPYAGSIGISGAEDATPVLIAVATLLAIGKVVPIVYRSMLGTYHRHRDNGNPGYATATIG